MYCRHCTRKRKVGDQDYNPVREDYEAAFQYIEQHHEVRDVLLSGGDPFLLEDDMIDYLLDRLNRIDHVEVIRIGTRTPVVLPFRITQGLVDILSQYKTFGSIPTSTTQKKSPKRPLTPWIVCLRQASHLVTNLFYWQMSTIVPGS